MKRFLDLADFSREDVLELIALAQRLEAHPEPSALAGKILGLIFLIPRYVRWRRSRWVCNAWGVARL